MRIIVTGAAGFIGSNLAEALLQRGDTVLGIDCFNDYYDPAVKRGNIASVKASAAGERFSLAEVDIRDTAALDATFVSFRADAVVHLAAYAGVQPSIKAPELYYDVNVTGTLNIAEAMKRHGVRRLIFASSSSVYGNNPKVPFSESDNVDGPISPYAATKKSGELMLHVYHALYGMSVACLRFFTVYGPRQRPDLAISKFATLLFQGKPIPMYGDGSTSRDYTYITDTLDGVIKAIDWTDGDAKYEVFNLGESHAVSLLEMIETISRATGIPAEIQRMPAQPGDVERTFADTGKARSILGYAPKVEFAEGIEKYIAWRREGEKYDA